MKPERITVEPERSFSASIDDITAVLDKSYAESGSVDKAVDKLKKLLALDKERE